jgi:hypothetical protein
LAATGGEAFDLSFIDGLHLLEFAVRDFINVERYSSPTGVIIFDDVLPRTVDEAARQRHTQSWTGDVYHMLTVLARYRPELLVLPVATQPTGLLLVTDLDPTSTVLRDHYDDIMAEYRSPDPQPVPDIIFDRQLMLRPQRVLSSPMWDILKTSVASALPPATFRSRLVNAVVTSFGSAFGPASLPS